MIGVRTDGAARLGADLERARAENRSALLIDGADFAEDGSVRDADWQPLPEDDPLLGIVCET